MNEHATQSLGYCLLRKIQHVSYKIGTFFSKESFLVHPTLSNFTLRKKKMYDANELLALSPVIIIVYSYSLGKNI